MILRGLLLVGLLGAGCNGKKRAGGDPVPPVPEPTGAPRDAAPARDASSSGDVMVTDFVPHKAFLAHAAQRLRVRPDELVGGAIDEATARSLPHSIGGAWAYTMHVRADPQRDARGWVTADGTVITPDQNLGRLFVEAGAWTRKPAQTPRQLADHIAWSYGMNHAVVIEPENGAPAPRLDVAPDGSGTFRFFVSYRQPGPGGAGGGPRSLEEVRVTLTPDHQATLTRTPKTP